MMPCDLLSTKGMLWIATDGRFLREKDQEVTNHVGNGWWGMDLEVLGEPLSSLSFMVTDQKQGSSHLARGDI